MAKKATTSKSGGNSAAKSASGRGTAGRAGKGGKNGGGKSSAAKSSGGKSAGASMSKSKASRVLLSGRSGESQKSEAALALSGQKSKAERRASGKKPMYERNVEQPWAKADEKALRDLAGENTPTRVIGLKLGRSESSIYDKAADLGLSLKPSNRSPNKGGVKK